MRSRLVPVSKSMNRTPSATRVSSPEASSEPAHASPRQAIILVVERDPHVRDLESYFLHEAGYGVEFASDGMQALQMTREQTPDIIVTEILVPKLDGLALCRAVKSDAALRSTAVLIFSILAAESRAREAGADAFILKPLSEHRLVDTVRALLAKRVTPSGAE
jgi:DNA-binding response OmpR family regulator